MTFGRGVGVPIAVESGRVAEDSLEEIGAEVRSSLSTSRRESPDGSAPSQLLISAGEADTAALANALGAALNLPAQAYQRAGLGSLVAAGAIATARGDRGFAIELLPESEVQRRAATVSRARGLRVVVAVLIAALATAGLYGQMRLQRTAYLADLDAKADSLRPLAQTLRTKRQQLKLIEDQVHRAASPIQILATIAKVAPNDGLDFTRFSYDIRQGVTVNGSAIEPKKFEDLIDGMRKAGIDTMPQFARAQELYRTERMDYGKKVWDFAISIPFTGEADGK
jgi:hypothetical protein